MKCETARSEIVAYLRGELPPEEASGVASHLERCLACRREEATVRGLMETIRDVTTVDPTPGFRERVMESTRREGEGARSAGSSRVARPRNLFLAFLRERVRKAPILVAAVAVHAAAIFLLAGVYLPIRLSRPRPFQMDPGMAGPDLKEGQVEEMERSISKEFDALRPVLEPSVDPTLPFPWTAESVIGKGPGREPVRHPEPTLNPEDFDQPIRSRPARAEVLAWYGSRLDGRKKAEARKRWGGPETARMLARGLAWLSRAQGEDGGFDPAPFGGKAHFKTGITGLALLAFLGDGNTITRGSFGRNVESGVAFLLDEQDPKTGRFGPARGNYMYNHGIALLALCETYGMALTDPPAERKDLTSLSGAIRKGVAYLLNTQTSGGGWGYTARDRGSDTSVSAWPLASLSSALRLKLVPAGKGAAVGQALERASGWFRSVTLPSGPVGYRALAAYKTGPHSLTAVSLYCRGLFARGVTPDRENVLDKQVGIVASRAPSTGGTPDFYFWYYAAFGLRHSGRDAFRPFFKNLVQVLASLQKVDGGFPHRSLYGPYGGRVYTTAMALLTLEVPYRYPVR